MRRFLGVVLVAALLAGPGARADEPDPKAVLDKAIKALGGEEKLSKSKMTASKTKGTISFAGNDNEFTGHATVSGLDHSRQGFESEIMGNKISGVTVLAGDKGWRKFGDMVMGLDKDGLANEKRSVYLQVIPVTLVPLKGKGFKVEAAGTEKVGDKSAVVLKVTGPEGKDYKLYFDQDSGLPVKQVAKVISFMGEEFTQETTFADYKDFDGIKKATKIEVKRDGETFQTQEVTEFKVLDKVPPDTFAEPK